jgi:hypothetical protein
MQGVEGIEGLGEPATGAAIAAATSVMTAIAGLLKGIGSLRKKPQANSVKENSEQSNGNNESASTETPSSDTPTSETSSTKATQNESTQDTSVNAKDGVDNSSSSNAPETTTEPSNTTDANSSSTSADDTALTENARGAATTNAKDTKASPMVKVKTWVKENPIKTGAIALAAVGLVTWAVIAFSKKDKKGTKKNEEMSGVPKKKKNKHKHASNPNYFPKHNTHIKIQKLK